jgi:hypothetical protein
MPPNHQAKWRRQNTKADRFHKIDFRRKQPPSIAMDLMYNHKRGKRNPYDPDRATPHYHESRPRKTQQPRKENLKLLAGSLSTLDSLLGEKVCRLG